QSKKEAVRATASAVFDDGSLVEMLHRPEHHQTLLCVMRDGGIEELDRLKSKKGTLVPYSPENNLLVHDVLLFPSEPAEYETTAKLVHEIRSFIHSYADISPLFEQVASYYV